MLTDGGTCGKLALTQSAFVTGATDTLVQSRGAWLVEGNFAVPTISGSYQQKGAGGLPSQHTPPGQSESTLQDPQELELLLPEHCPPPDGGAVTTQAEFRVRRIHLPSLSVTLMDDV